MMAMTSTNNPMPRTNAAGIHKGADTHHQLQLMTFVNFSTKKVMNNAPLKPIPPVEIEYFLLSSIVSPPVD